MSTSQNSEPTKKKKKKKRKKSNPVAKTFAVIGTTLLSLFLILIITGSIVITALTVYVMEFQEPTSGIDLRNLELSCTTFIYGTDSETGERYLVDTISSDANRIIVDYDYVPDHVKNAFVYREDARFFQHQGVDFKRTFRSFLDYFLHIFGNTGQGGSTITQQLVKNITKDDEETPERKMREIFTAMNLEAEYTKEDILEAYLNYIGMGGTTYGVEAAAQKYFGKSCNELSVAEAASLAAIPKSPNSLNPFSTWIDEDGNSGVERNKYWQEIVLQAMLDNGAISKQEYDEAVAEELVFNRKIVTDEDMVADDVQSYYIDAAIYQIIDEFMEKYNCSWDDARKKLYNGGYTIDIPIDMKIQKQLEAKYQDYTTFSSEVLNDPPQSAAVIMDYFGNVKAVVGGVGAKPGDLCLNRATDSLRPPGSTFKPISSYAMAVSLDMVNWTSIFTDKPIILRDGTKWPRNYTTISTNNAWTYNNYFLYEALARSINTIPAQMLESLTPRGVYDFIKMRFPVSENLVESMTGYGGGVVTDVDLAPMAIGQLTLGATLTNMVASYQAFGNLGACYDPTFYTKVVDNEGNIVLQHKYYESRALDEESAWVMNRLMKQVIEHPNGTGKAARLENTELIGKTGTSEDWKDIWFIGCTPDYVSGVWYGYDTPANTRNTYYSSAVIWKNVFGDIVDTGTSFIKSDKVQELRYCSASGMLCNGTCPVSANPGYFKSSNVPGVCPMNHSAPVETAPAATEAAPPADTTPAAQPAETTPAAVPEETSPPVTETIGE